MEVFYVAATTNISFFALAIPHDLEKLVDTALADVIWRSPVPGKPAVPYQRLSPKMFVALESYWDKRDAALSSKLLGIYGAKVKLVEIAVRIQNSKAEPEKIEAARRQYEEDVVGVANAEAEAQADGEKVSQAAASLSVMRDWLVKTFSPEAIAAERANPASLRDATIKPSWVCDAVYDCADYDQFLPPAGSKEKYIWKYVGKKSVTSSQAGPAGKAAPA